MTAREEAEQLRQQAIKKLLEERDAVDEQLKLLGYGLDAKSPAKRRGRPPKQATPQPDLSEGISGSETAPTDSSGSEL
jgi:hypothetical protein